MEHAEILQGTSISAMLKAALALRWAKNSGQVLDCASPLALLENCDCSNTAGDWGSPKRWRDVAAEELASRNTPNAKADDQQTGKPTTLYAEWREFLEQDKQRQQPNPPEVHHAADEEQQHQRPATAEAIKAMCEPQAESAHNAAIPML